jgi:tetratricopeptide (TPR) repeat protein
LGNLHYQKKQFETAAQIYTQSLEIWEDYRTYYGNRSAACVKIAIYRLRNGITVFRRHFKYAFNDASKAVTMGETYKKGYFQEAKGDLGYRNLPRAKHAC